MQHLKFTFVLASLFGVMSTAAYARPNVTLHLSGAIVGHDQTGKTTLEPVTDSTQFQPGETVRYDVVASNSGTDPALKLMPTGKIPSGTVYEAGTASSSNTGGVEFSLDGGKTWAKIPTVKVTTPKGVVEKKADPATYTAIRWIMAKPLAPKSSVSYSYEVRVK